MLSSNATTSIFQATATLFQQLSIGNFEQYLVIPAPDLSAGAARKTFLLFIPGNLPGIGLFIVFGTTTAFRKHMRETYIGMVIWAKEVYRWTTTKRLPRKRQTVYSDLPSPRMGYVPYIYSPNVNKALPHRPDSRTDGEDGSMELREAEKAIVHERNTIFVMRTLSVQRSDRHIDDRMPTDSTKDSTPSLLIMRPSTDERR